MKNIAIIAKKEFSDLLSNNFVIIVISIYLLFVLITSYDGYVYLTNHNITKDIIVFYILSGIWYILTFYGSFVGMVIGFLSISGERHSNALNTLIVKPVYRDTIINGKFIGSACFLGCVFGLVTMIFTSMFFIFYGSYTIEAVPDLILRVPAVVLLAVIYAMIFFFISMSISILVDDRLFAMILSFIMFCLSETIPTTSFSMNIAYILRTNDDMILRQLMELSPAGISGFIVDSSLFNATVPFYGSLLSISMEVIRLVLFLILPMILCYSLFLRRDIT